MKPHHLLMALLALTTALHAQTSNLGEGDSYAYGANIGWIELTPHRPVAGNGVRVSDTLLSGFAWSANTGWINFGSGAPADQIRYSNTDGTDFGVTHDGAGNLGGLAWSANLGWINFGWAAPTNPNRPRINLLHGAFTGYAWSSNAGWINLDTGYLKTDSIAITDTDADGLSDSWERQHVGKLITLTATGDNDGDGISNYQEYLADTDPLSTNSRMQIASMSQFPDGEPATSLTTTLTWPSSPARLYKIQHSSDLATWTDAAPGLFLPDTGTTTTRGITHAITEKLFFRIQSAPPLAP
jgi:hypothetical protein